MTQGLGDFKVLKVSGKFALTSPHLIDWLLLNKLLAWGGGVGDDDNWQLWGDNGSSCEPPQHISNSSKFKTQVFQLTYNLEPSEVV